MASCEMCGKAAAVRAEVEQVMMEVCMSCARYGKVVARPTLAQQRVVRREGPEMMVVEEYDSLLKKSREKLGMTQEEFAKHLQERESVVAKWEQGSLKPSVEAAQQVGRKLGLSLVVQSGVESGIPAAKTAAQELTLGDFVKVRKRK